MNKPTKTATSKASGKTSCSTDGLRVLELFAGIGGASLGLHRSGGFRTIAFCEIELFPRKVLKKNFPGIPIFDDVRTLHAEDLPEPVDVIWASYPCQPFSTAGKQRGAKDDRYLWPEVIRLVRECCPSWVLGENVAGHIHVGLDQVLSDMESEGYTTRTFIIPACAVNACHRRDRVWIIAYDEGRANGEYNSKSMQRQKQKFRESISLGTLSNSNSINPHRPGGTRNRGQNLQTKVLLPTPLAQDSKGKMNSPSQQHKVWELSIAIKLLPTPTCNDTKNATLHPSQADRNSISGKTLAGIKDGRLNPEFVREMMGYPEGWLDVD